MNTQESLKLLSDAIGMDVSTGEKFQSEANKLMWEYYQHGFKAGYKAALELVKNNKPEKEEIKDSFTSLNQYMRR